MNEELENRCTNLEIKLAYMEDFLNKLQNIAVEQGKILDKIVAENRVLKNKVRELIEAQEEDMPNRRPPHY